MYLETINEKAFRSFLSNPDISVLDGNVLDKHHNRISTVLSAFLFPMASIVSRHYLGKCAVTIPPA